MGIRTQRYAALAIQPRAIADPGDGLAISVEQSGYVNLVTGGAETRTLAAPTFVGQQIQFNFIDDGGDCVITVASTVNQAGNNTLTFADAGDILILVAGQLAVGTIEWKVLLTDGVALATV